MSEIRYEYDPKTGVDTTQQVIEFIGDDAYVCPVCGGYGEYEGEYGPQGCMLCCSRLIPFVDADGKMQTLDWGESVRREPDGLHKVGG